MVDALVILLLPALFPSALGGNIVWFTFGIYEAVVLAVSVVLLRRSEQNGIVYE